MARCLIFAFLALILLFRLPLQAQDIQLPEYTMEQRWNRLSYLSWLNRLQLLAMKMESGMSAREIGADDHRYLPVRLPGGAAPGQPHPPAGLGYSSPSPCQSFRGSSISRM